MLGTEIRDYVSELTSFDLRVNGDLFQLPAGPLQVGLGAESRWEYLTFNNDRMDQQGLWLAATPVQPFSSRKTVHGIYAETRIPVFGGKQQIRGAHLLELSLAVRHDDYGKTGRPTVPKYSVRWLPFNDEFALRGTWSESFSAPTLFDLYGPITAGFTSAINISRYDSSGNPLNLFTGSRQYRSQSGSNSLLQPSRSRNWTVGVVWSPKAVKGLSLSADWFNIDERDLISSVTSTTITQDVEKLGPKSNFASLVRLGTSLNGESHFTDGAPITAPGQITSGPSDAVWISNQSTNIAGIWQDGLDLQLNYVVNTQRMGRVSFSSARTYIRSYNQQTLPTDKPSNLVDGYNGSVYARYRTHSRLDWFYKDFSVGIGHTYVASLDDLINVTPYRVAHYHTADLQGTYTFAGWNNKYLKGLQLQVGMNNVFNAMPPLIPSESNQSHDINAYDPIGRFIYTSVKFKF